MPTNDPLADLLAADRIVILVDPNPRDAVLDAAARLLSGGLPTMTLAIADGMRARERIGTTAIGRGVAIPHCRSTAFSTPRGAFLRLTWPIDFAASDGEPVDLIFAMTTPEGLAQQHLYTLSALAERFADAEFRETLRDASDLAGLRRALLAPSAETQGLSMR